MKRWSVVTSILTMLLVSTVGCGPSGTSLTAQQLKEQNQDAKYVEIDGVSLHYRQDGLGKPLIFLHGFLTSSNIWRSISPGLTYGNTIYALDLMGSGLSEKPQNQVYSIDTYVTQLSKFIDGFHLENPIIVGHGIGGSIATVYAIRNPGKVRKLALLNTPLHPGHSAPGLWLLKIPLVGGTLTGDWFLQRTLRGGVDKPKSMSDSVMNDYLKVFQNDPGARVALLKQVKELNLDSVLKSEAIPNLAQLKIPTQLIWGDRDTYVPLDEGKKIKETVSTADLYVVLGTGHYPTEERPEDVRQRLKDFIDQQ
ncbi:MAG: alpha/beta hydrolase [Deltaproteobacteria bacterium]|nr:alpha/beta hydrolase [Deltaproteobacteria bacterium]